MHRDPTLERAQAMEIRRWVLHLARKSDNLPKEWAKYPFKSLDRKLPGLFCVPILGRTRMHTLRVVQEYQVTKIREHGSPVLETVFKSYDKAEAERTVAMLNAFTYRPEISYRDPTFDAVAKIQEAENA